MMRYAKGLIICIAVLSLNTHASSAPLPDSLLIRDLPAGNIQVVPITVKGNNLTAHGEGLDVTGSIETLKGGFRLNFTAVNQRAGDRGSEVSVSFPVQSSLLAKWWSDYQTSVPISQGQVYSETLTWADPVDPPFNTSGRVWRRVAKYPVFTVAGSHRAVTLAVPIGSPRCFRLSCDTSKNTLIASFDLGFSDAALKNRQRADFTVLIYDTDARWGMRDALDKYYAYYPEYTTSRAVSTGAWTFWASGTTCPWDFGLKFNEVSFPEVAKDHAHGMYDLMYEEPWGPRHAIRSWKDTAGCWHPVGSDGSRTQDAAKVRGAIEADAKATTWDSEPAYRQDAQMILNSAVVDKDGGYVWHLETYPKMKIPSAYMMLTNCDPDIAAPSPWSKALGLQSAWVKNTSHAVGGQLDGTYMDSLTFWCGNFVDDYSRAHLAVSDLPLVASQETGKPVTPQCFGNFKFIKAARQDTNAWGHILLGNLGDPSFFPVFSTVLDVLGIEAGQTYGNAPDSEYRFYRSYAVGKPISWLAYGFVNPKFSLEEKEKGMKRSLFYDVHVGSAEFSDETAVGSLRPLYRKYEPVIRWLDAARWRPITRASAADGLLVERYGEGDPFFIAVRNPTDHRVDGRLVIESPLGPGYICFGILSPCRKLIAHGGAVAVSLGADDTEVYAIGTKSRISRLWTNEASTWLDLAVNEARWINWAQPTETFEKSPVGWTGQTSVVSGQNALCGTQSLKISGWANKTLWLPDDRRYTISFRYRKSAGTQLTLNIATNSAYIDRDMVSGTLLGPDNGSLSGVYCGTFKLAAHQYAKELRLHASGNDVIIDDLSIRVSGNAPDLTVLDEIRTGSIQAKQTIGVSLFTARAQVARLMTRAQTISDLSMRERVQIPLQNAINNMDSALALLR